MLLCRHESTIAKYEEYKRGFGRNILFKSDPEKQGELFNLAVIVSLHDEVMGCSKRDPFMIQLYNTTEGWCGGTKNEKRKKIPQTLIVILICQTPVTRPHGLMLPMA